MLAVISLVMGTAIGWPGWKGLKGSKAPAARVGATEEIAEKQPQEA